MPPAPPAQPKQPTRLSPRGLLAYRIGFAAGLAGFAVACAGLFLLTGMKESSSVSIGAGRRRNKSHPPSTSFFLSDTGASSPLATTPLADAYRAIVRKSPFLIGALFNVSMFASVLTMVRLQEHAAALATIPPPRSRQERRARERDFKAAVSRMGGRIVEGGKVD